MLWIIVAIRYSLFNSYLSIIKSLYLDYRIYRTFVWKFWKLYWGTNKILCIWVSTEYWEPLINKQHSNHSTVYSVCSIKFLFLWGFYLLKRHRLIDKGVHTSTVVHGIRQRNQICYIKILQNLVFHISKKIDSEYLNICISVTVFAPVTHKCNIYLGEKIDASRHSGIIRVINSHAIALAQFYCLSAELCTHKMRPTPFCEIMIGKIRIQK